MKKAFTVFVLIALLLSVCTGCSIFSGKSWQDLPEHPLALKSQSYQEDPTDGGYRVFTYQGRIFAPYGTQSKTINGKIIKECIGYLDEDTDWRVYTLYNTDDFLAEFYVSGIMMQVEFYRALDTKEKAIFIPDYIDSFDYEIWQ